MKMEHTAVWTTDIERLADFYEKYFNGKRNLKYRNDKKGFESYFITFDGGASRLEIMNKADLAAKKGDAINIGFAHMAFSTGSKQSVIDLTLKLKQDGYMVLSDPRVTGDGYFESTILDPDENIIEITE